MSFPFRSGDHPSTFNRLVECFRATVERFPDERTGDHVTYSMADAAIGAFSVFFICVNGNAKQVEISRAFGVSKISLERAVKLYREQGPKGFYAPRNRRGPAVLARSVLAEAQQLLDEGLETPENTIVEGVAAQLRDRADPL